MSRYDLDQRIASITEQYAQHVITARGERNGLGWWVMHRLYSDGRKSSDLWTEVIEGHGGYLHVNGDILACVFGICGSSAQPGPGRQVAWMVRPSPSDGGVCSHCGGPLVPGTRVRRMAEKVDGALMSHSWCNECCKAMTEDVEPDDADDDWLPAWELRCGLHGGRLVTDTSEGGAS